MVGDEQFIRLWQGASSRREVAGVLGMTLDGVSKRASQLRRAGFDLKRAVHPRRPAAARRCRNCGDRLPLEAFQPKGCVCVACWADRKLRRSALSSRTMARTWAEQREQLRASISEGHLRAWADPEARTQRMERFRAAMAKRREAKRLAEEEQG